jgi:hypothetical protein
MDFRRHAAKAVDYSIIVALASIVIVPVLFFGSIGPGMGTEPEPDPTSQRVALAFFAYCAPAIYSVKLLHSVGLRVGIVDWLVMCITVPAFWGTILYLLTQPVRMLRQRLTSRCS